MTTLRSLSSLLLIVSLGLAAPGCALEGEGDHVAEVTGRPYANVWRTNGLWFFNFKAANHEIILSSQSYSSRTAALGGFLSVLENGTESGRFDFRVSTDGRHYFVLQAANGAIIGKSQLYSSSRAAGEGVKAVIRNVTTYNEYQASRTGARFDIIEGRDGRFYFSLKAGNGETVLRSQGYSSRAGALNGTLSVLDYGVDATSYNLEQSADGGYYFNLIAANGETIATSEVYASKYNAKRAIESITDLLPHVEVL